MRNKIFLLLMLVPLQVFAQFQNQGPWFWPRNSSPDIDPEVKKCVETVDGFNSQFGFQERPLDVCENKINLAKIQNQKDEIESCMKDLRSFTGTWRDLLSTCLDDGLRTELAENQGLRTCLEKSRILYWGQDQILLCRDPSVQAAIAVPQYRFCLGEYGVAFPRALTRTGAHACLSPSIQSAVSGPLYSRCRRGLENIGISSGESARHCIDVNHQSEVHLDWIKSCSNQISPIVGPRISGLYCVRTGLSHDNFSPKSIACAQEVSKKFLAPLFFQDDEKERNDLPLFEKILVGCQQPGTPPVAPYSPFSFVTAKFMSMGTDFLRTRVGGLSGLSYDRSTGELYAVSDDPGLRNKPRFYVLNLDLNKDEFSLEFENRRFLKTKEDSFFENEGPFESVFSYIDPEGIVLTPSKEVIVSTETLLRNSKSYIKVFDREGNQIDEIFLSEKFTPKNESSEGPGKACPQKQTQGIVFNKGFESLGMTADGEILYTANERPLVQDQLPCQDVVRIVKLKKNNQNYRPEAEFAYELDEWPDNGLVDILAYDSHRILTLERSFDPVMKKVTSQIFLVDLSGATNYIDIASFRDEEMKAPVNILKKKLLLNLDHVLPFLPEGLRLIDNLEGMTLGPRLPNGKQSLILVSDNNFAPAQFTQFIVLEFSFKDI